MRRVLRTASSLLVAGFAFSVPAGGESAAVNGLIAFESDASGTPQVWLMNQDGTNPRRLADGRTPAWSSDGTRLAFVTPDGGHLAVVDADGGDRRIVEVAAAARSIVSPSWSPDGKTIAFGSSEAVYSVSSNGGRATRLAAGYEPAPAWSPDGTRIAYIAQDGSLTVMRADGSAAEVVVGARGEAARSVAWAPDGSEIAYGDSSGGLSTVRLDGTQPTSLIPYLGTNSLSDPAWSPDGTRIAFFDNADICVANLDGSEIGRLTYTPVHLSGGTTGHPAWQPLPPRSTAAGSPVAIAGPVGRWDRDYAWYPACISIWRGLAVTAAAPARIAAGSLLTVELTVTNRTDRPLGVSGLVGLGVGVRNGKFVRVTPTQGSCTGGRYTHVFDCELGALFPGERAQMRLRLLAGSPGILVLTCSLPLPAEAVGTTPLPPDCLRRIRVRRR